MLLVEEVALDRKSHIAGKVKRHWPQSFSERCTFPFKPGSFLVVILKTQLLTAFRSAKEDALDAEATSEAITMAKYPCSGCRGMSTHN